MRVQILETEYLPLQYQPLLLYSIFKRFGVCNQFTMSPVKTKNRHLSYEKESFDEHNHHYDAASVIKYGNLGFFASHFLPIPSLSDSFFFSYMDSSTNFCLETNYQPDILDMPVEEEQTLPVYVPRVLFLKYSEELWVVRLS